ncbi:MAG: TonB-dependent receptor plug domain-containing protein, partial [Bacteroidota bacterium]|nr:TonB-dependent receptor plug domain-containing protein [Bacteroidota bacterium]
MKKNLIILFCILLMSQLTLNAQERFPIKGTVIGLDSAALAGAKLSLKQSQTQTIADARGNFVLISHFPIDTITIEYIGYATQTLPVSAAKRSPFIFRLTGNAQTLEEVTVQTGYQSVSREKATGSYAQVSNHLFNEQVGTTVLARLDGIANGLTVDKKRANAFSTGIMIRGLSTIGGPKDPLIVLDNFPYDGDLDNINPNDVESITLLKDAAAAAIWGTRAGNGVIVITTKKGHFNQPVSIDFSSNISRVSKPDIWNTKPISSSDYIDVEEFLYGKGFYNSNINSIVRPALSPVVELLIKKTNGQISAAEADAKIDALRKVDVRNDFAKYIYSPAVLQQYALNLRGGSQNISWLLSGGYDHNISDLSATLRRISLRSENTIRFSAALQLTAG